MTRPDSGSEDGHKSASKEVGLLNLAHQVTEEELTQRRRAAINPIPQSSPESSFCFVSDGVLKRGEKVFLNVYNLGGINPYLRACLCCGSGGLAIYHSAIEVYGIEYAFGGHPTSSSGVFETKPFHQLIENGVLPDNISLHEQHYLGVTSKSPLKIADVVSALAPAWPGNGYDLIRRNCNHFATELAEALKLRPACAIPAHVNRIARVATAISCCLPKSIKDTDWSDFDSYAFSERGLERNGEPVRGGRRLGSAIDHSGNEHAVASRARQMAGEGDSAIALAARRREYERVLMAKHQAQMKDVCRLPAADNITSYAALAAIHRWSLAAKGMPVVAARSQPFNLHLMAKGGKPQDRHDVPEGGLPAQVSMGDARAGADWNTTKRLGVSASLGKTGGAGTRTSESQGQLAERLDKMEVAAAVVHGHAPPATPPPQGALEACALRLEEQVGVHGATAEAMEASLDVASPASQIRGSLSPLSLPADASLSEKSVSSMHNGGRRGLAEGLEQIEVTVGGVVPLPRATATSANAAPAP